MNNDFVMVRNDRLSKKLGYPIYNRKYDFCFNTMFDCILLKPLGVKTFHNMIVEGERQTMKVDCYAKRTPKELIAYFIVMTPIVILGYLMLVLMTAWAGY